MFSEYLYIARWYINCMLHYLEPHIEVSVSSALLYYIYVYFILHKVGSISGSGFHLLKLWNTWGRHHSSTSSILYLLISMLRLYIPLWTVAIVDLIHHDALSVTYSSVPICSSLVSLVSSTFRVFFLFSTPMP